MNTDKRHIELIKRFFDSCITGVRSFKATTPRKWLEEKGLNYNELEIGFSSGQFSHRKDEAFKQSYVEVGILTPSDAPVREAHLKAYTCFGTYAIVFPLRNEAGQIVNLYAIGLKGKKKKEYLNDNGLYPGYPASLTQRLFICVNVMDTASLLQAKILENRDAVLSLHDGELKEQHIHAIAQLKHLTQIVFIHG